MMLQDDTTAYSILTRTTTTIATNTITAITATTATARQLPTHYRHHLVKSSFTILLSHAFLDLILFAKPQPTISARFLYFFQSEPHP